MLVFTYDKSFEGLLSALFEAYSRKQFPDTLLETGDPPPLFVSEAVSVHTHTERAARVWKKVLNQLSPIAIQQLMACWLSELPGTDMLILRYLKKAIDSPGNISLNFSDPEVLAVTSIAKKVQYEKMRMVQFVRFQKTEDETYVAPIEPEFNVLPLITNHFQDRFADQKWLIFDVRRKYGYYYDLKETREIRFTGDENDLFSGKVKESLLSEDEKSFQSLWKAYFKAIAIKERINPKLHRQHMPKRYWKYLTEKKRE